MITKAPFSIATTPRCKEVPLHTLDCFTLPLRTMSQKGWAPRPPVEQPRRTGKKGCDSQKSGGQYVAVLFSLQLTSHTVKLLATLHFFLIMLSDKQVGIKYHFLSLCYDSTWDWTPVSRTIGEHSIHLAKRKRLRSQNERETKMIECLKSALWQPRGDKVKK